MFFGGASRITGNKRVLGSVATDKGKDHEDHIEGVILTIISGTPEDSGFIAVC
jgi:CobQ-like glutamine amidotransferase family enzyme